MKASNKEDLRRMKRLGLKWINLIKHIGPFRTGSNIYSAFAILANIKAKATAQMSALLSSLKSCFERFMRPIVNYRWRKNKFRQRVLFSSVKNLKNNSSRVNTKKE
jgi:hypothetical protein